VSNNLGACLIHGHWQSQSCNDDFKIAPQSRQPMVGGTTQQQRVAMTDEPDWMAREREMIAARVARFRAMQRKLQREREEYYAATLSSAWEGFNKPIVWN
jgi:hypothetical protein